MARILVAQPGYGMIENESYLAAAGPLASGSEDHATVIRTRSSLLAHNFNDCLAVCLNNGFDFFAVLHADMAADKGWVTTLKDEMIAASVDVMHAPAAIKDGRGLTSTAIAYNDDPWQVLRRLTTAELNALPPTFTVGAIRDEIDEHARYLLPNTGCLLVKAEPWLKEFPGFEIRDRLRRVDNSTWVSEVLPEDWNFGLWCGRNGVAVGATRKVVTHHYGRADHPSSTVWGENVDRFWLDRQSTALEETRMEVMTT